MFQEGFCTKGCGLRARKFSPYGVEDNGTIVEIAYCGHWYCRTLAALRVLIFGFPEFEYWVEDEFVEVYDDEDEDGL